MAILVPDDKLDCFGYFEVKIVCIKWSSFFPRPVLTPRTDDSSLSMGGANRNLPQKLKIAGSIPVQKVLVLFLRACLHYCSLGNIGSNITASFAAGCDSKVACCCVTPLLLIIQNKFKQTGVFCLIMVEWQSCLQFDGNLS